MSKATTTTASSSKHPAAPLPPKKNKAAIVPMFLDEDDTVAGVETAAANAHEVQVVTEYFASANDLIEEEFPDLTLDQLLELREKDFDGIERAVGDERSTVP